MRHLDQSLIDTHPMAEPERDPESLKTVLLIGTAAVVLGLVLGPVVDRIVDHFRPQEQEGANG